MEKENKNYKSSDAGYSLIELVVTVLISSVIVAAVVGFLVSGLNHFRKVNAETKLQTESQVTDIFVTELIQECRNFVKVDSTDYPAGADIKGALQIWRGTDCYILAQIGNELHFGKVKEKDASGNDITVNARLTELIGMGRSKTFLAQYVDNVVWPSSYWDTINLDKGMVDMQIVYKVDEKTYYSRLMITPRNMKRN